MNEILDSSRPTLCLYHNDPDGCCAAAVVRRAVGPALSLQPLEIGEPVPWDRISAHEQIVLVDYSFAPADMQRLRDGWRFVWVDHHISSIGPLAEAMAGVPGERSVEAAACVLAWRSFLPSEPVPQAVALIGDRDTWQMRYPDTRPFGEGLIQENLDPANDALWAPLLDDDVRRLQQLIELGRVLYDARLRSIAGIVAHYGFETTFEGHRTLAVNHRGNGDMGEYIRRAGYPVGYCYVEVVRAGVLQTTVTLYSDGVDVSAIARKFGGGGHRGAAGFQFLRGDRPFPPGSEGQAP